MQWFAVYLIFSILAATYAADKQLSFIRYFIVSLLFSPLIGVLAAAADRPNEQQQRERKKHNKNYKLCLYCDSYISHRALICPHCQKPPGGPDE